MLSPGIPNFVIIAVVLFLFFYLEYGGPKMKRNKEDQQWFEGLKWAEDLFFKQAPLVAENIIDMHTEGKSDPFDRGARDYVLHRIHSITRTDSFKDW